MENSKLSYEDAVEELKEVIENLEEDETTLSNSVEKFKRGVKLYKHCNKLLSNAEGEVKILLEDSERDLKEVDFFEEDEKDNF